VTAHRSKLERIALALESIARSLELLANPPVVVQGRGDGCDARLLSLGARCDKPCAPDSRFCHVHSLSARFRSQ
jgi:hypothetical protein